jgi:hypothetical protein
VLKFKKNNSGARRLRRFIVISVDFVAEVFCRSVAWVLHTLLNEIAAFLFGKFCLLFLWLF